jgi:hypothetical protein
MYCNGDCIILASEFPNLRNVRGNSGNYGRSSTRSRAIVACPTGTQHQVLSQERNN